MKDREGSSFQPHPYPAASAAMKLVWCMIWDCRTTHSFKEAVLLPLSLERPNSWFPLPSSVGALMAPQREAKWGRISLHIVWCHCNFIFDFVINVSVPNWTVSSVTTRDCDCLFSPLSPPNFSFSYLLAVCCWS